MSALVSMLVPLQTLPGWPAATDPPWLEIGGLLIGIPAAVVIVFSVIGKLTARRHADEAPQPETGDEPLWLGGPSGAGRAIPGGEIRSLPATVTGASTAYQVPSEAPEKQEVGGASARW